MQESPRIRRLRSDLRAMRQLQSESTIFTFSTPGETYAGGPEFYVIRFYGTGLWRPDAELEVLPRYEHEVRVNLGASYPRMMPDLTWKTPIFHPNISGSGIVCLGGYGTHWAPSLQLDELTHMLWEMVRFANYDVLSPYNREAAHWAKTQNQFRLPVDPRPLRDRIVAGTVAAKLPGIAKPAGMNGPNRNLAGGSPEIEFLDSARNQQIRDQEIIDAEIIDAELVTPADSEILFID